MSITYTSGMNHDDLVSTLKHLQGDKTFTCSTDKETGEQTWEWSDGSTPATKTQLTNARSVAVAKTQWLAVRLQRDAELAKCDWTQAVDNPLSDTKKTEWATYRQSLRDVGNQSDPFKINWPTEPL